MKTTNKETKIYNFFEDPGHGWVEVDIKEILNLNLENKISGCSYINKNKVYLEEDGDASIFFNTLKAKGVLFEFKVIYDKGLSIVRYYPPYNINSLNAEAKKFINEIVE